MRPLLLCVLCLSSAAYAQASAHVTPATATPSLPSSSLRARLDKETIRAAIAATPADEKPAPGREETAALSGSAYQGFARDFAEARLPDCLHSEGLKNQPTFFLSGFLALPFIAVAKVRGVCR